MFVSKLSNGLLETMGHGVWVPAQGRDDDDLNDKLWDAKP
jgi:hypothetical protein